jgi:hypothetical protein
MSQGYTIEVVITEEGEIQADVQGVLGAGCEGLSAFLKELGDVIEDQRKPEYYRRQGTARRLTVGGGGMDAC